MPSISADEAPRLRPFIGVAEKLGSFAGQLTEEAVTAIVIEYAGEVGEMNTRALTSAALAGILQPMLGSVNMVSAPVVARERGIKVDEVKQTQRGAYETYIRLTVKTANMERSVAGTVFSDGKPRIIQIRASTWRPNSGRTCSTSPTRTSRLHRRARHAAGQCACEHRHLQSRPQGAGRRGDLPRVDRRADAGLGVLHALSKLPQVKQARPLEF